MSLPAVICECEQLNERKISRFLGCALAIELSCIALLLAFRFVAAVSPFHRSKVLILAILFEAFYCSMSIGNCSNQHNKKTRVVCRYGTALSLDSRAPVGYRWHELCVVQRIFCYPNSLASRLIQDSAQASGSWSAV